MSKVALARTQRGMKSVVSVSSFMSQFASDSGLTVATNQEEAVRYMAELAGLNQRA